MSVVKRVLVGKPLASSEEGHQRLVKLIALAIFASDAISSTAYASEEILHVLVPVAGMAALGYLIPISLIVMALLVIVVTSYRQTIFAYPSGGGSYVVSRDNLGEIPALVAGSSLLFDYVLTVAVSVSAGVAAITSAYPGLRDQRVAICLAFIAVLTVMNLRGVKESGRIFAVPTYVYVIALGALLVWGVVQTVGGDLGALPANEGALRELDAPLGAAAGGAGLLVLMRAFSSGAVALSGIEAIANGVPAFRKPESKNAATTLVWMGVILASFFFAISYLAQEIRPTVSEDETILSQMAEAVFDGKGLLYLVLQASTALILILAANTAYNAFPSMTSILAKDGYLPRQLANRGDRLVFSNGVLLLAATAALLIVAYGGITTALIPLYAVGVFTGFTLSQFGMVFHHRTHRDPGWRRNMVINGVGAIATAIVTLVVVVSKFAIGAGIPAIIIPLIVVLLKAINRHYKRVAERLRVPEGFRPRRHTHTVVVLVSRVHQGVLGALTYAKSLAPDRLVAVTVVESDEDVKAINEQWEQFGLDIPLQTLYSPYRELAPPVLRYLDELDEEYRDDIITVVLPEFVLTKWWQQLLHNQSALVLKARLLFRPNTVVTSVPYHLDRQQQDHLFTVTPPGP